MNASRWARLLQVTALLAWMPSAAQPLTPASSEPRPFDPLLARPPILDLARALPGDSAQPACSRTDSTPEGPLDLPRAVDIALCNNPQVRLAWSAIKLQVAQLGQARAAYLPVLTAGVARQSQRSVHPDPRYGAGSRHTGDSGHATLTWRLLDFGGRDADERAAQALLSAATAAHDASLQKIAASIISLYFDAQTAKAAREAKERAKNLAQETLEAARRREAHGAASRSDVLQAVTAWARADLELGRATGAHERALVALTVTMGMPGVVANQLLLLAADDLRSAAELRNDLAAWLAEARAHHPALVAARAQLEASRERVKQVRAEGLPTLDFTRGEYLNGRPGQGLSASRSRESVTALSLNVPLFDGFARNYKIQAAQAQVETEAAKVDEAELQILGEVARVHVDASAAIRNLEATRHLVQAAREAQAEVRRKYDKGAADILELLSVQLALSDAEQERVRSIAEWKSAQLRLLASAGAIGRRDLVHANAGG